MFRGHVHVGLPVSRSCVRVTHPAARPGGGQVVHGLSERRGDVAGRDVDAGHVVDDGVGLSRRARADHRPAIDIASRIVVIPAWKSVSWSGHDDEAGVGIELPQIELDRSLATVDVGRDVDARQQRRRAASTTGWPQR